MAGNNLNTTFNKTSAFSLLKNWRITGPTAIVLAATISLASLASSAVFPIKNILVDQNKQLVIEFNPQAGAFPSVPHLLDLPGHNHQIVFDFGDANVDKTAIHSPDDVADAVTIALPVIKDVRVWDLPNQTKPTARIVLDVPELLKVQPQVVKLDENSVTINLGGDLQGTATATDAAPALPVATASITSKIASSQVPSAASLAPAAAIAAATSPAAIVKDVQAPAPTGSITPSSENSSAHPSQGAWDWTSTNSPSTTTASGQSIPDTTTPAAIDASLKPSIKIDKTAASAVSTETPEIKDLFLKPAKTDSSVEEAKATKTDPKEAVRLYNDAVKAHIAGKLDEAIKAYRAAIKDNPDLSEAHSNLGLIFNQQHNYAQALTEFHKALAISPKDAITYNGVGAALRAEHDLEGAIKNWQTAVSLDPHLATAHYNLGTAYEISKDYDKAIESYKEAVTNDNRLGEAYYRMGIILERRHRMEEAVEQFRQSLKISGSAEYSQDARQRLAMLDQKKTVKR
jgi:Flp pilus assembly protein TadD